MVCEWGMSEKLGPLSFGKREEQVFLGREISQHRDYSETTAVDIDWEVKKIVEDNYQRARRLLQDNAAILKHIAQALLDRETLNLKDMDLIIEEHDPGLFATLTWPSSKGDNEEPAAASGVGSIEDSPQPNPTASDVSRSPEPSEE
jgi:cell division protease FtsH